MYRVQRYFGFLSGSRSVRRQTGFTLIELVIAIAIVGILMAIALPAYDSQVRSTRRATAKAQIMQHVQDLERFNTLNRTYLGFPCVNNPDIVDPLQYTVTCANLAPLTYTVTAAPVAGSAQAGDKCGSLAVTQTTARTITGGTAGTTAADCW